MNNDKTTRAGNMKVIFLDIDEVLRTMRTLIAYGKEPTGSFEELCGMLDPIPILFLRRLVEHTGTKVVLSSTWRLSEEWEKLSQVTQLPIFSRTPSLGGIRGRDIEKWLADNPGVTQYVIIDGDSDFLPDQLPHHVLINEQNGISFENMESICKLLDVDIFDVGSQTL